MRYSGDPVAARLAVAAATRVDGSLAPILADDARARIDGDGRLLLAAAVRFEALGAKLLAADGTYAAAHAFRRDRDSTRAARALVRAACLHDECEQASLPWLPRGFAATTLTRREHQVALLAAAGRSDARIADELGISVRTVQNHLSSVYGKLGVSGRRHLPDALVGR